MLSCPLQTVKSVKHRLAQAKIARKINLLLLETFIFPPEISYNFTLFINKFINIFLKLG
jgi:hypothetical protein